MPKLPPLARDALLCAALLLPYLLLKSYGLNPAVSDENIYFYDLQLMLQGQWPYKDFFFAHPPMHLVPGWLAMKIVGFSINGAKLLPVIASATAGIFVYLIAARAGGPIAGVLAAMGFLFSHDVLRAASHWTGINWSIAWMAAGLWAALGRRPALAGLLFALGATTGFYIIAGTLMALTLTTVIAPRDGLRFAIAFIVPFAAINLIFWGIGGQGFLDGVYIYHFNKPGSAGKALASQLIPVGFHNFHLLAAPLFLLPVLTLDVVFQAPWRQDEEAPASTSQKRRRSRQQKREFPWRQWIALADPREHPSHATGIWCVLFSAGYIFFLSLLSKVYHFYFLLFFPSAAVCAGMFLATFIALLRRSLTGAKEARARQLGVGAMAVAMLVGFLYYPTIEHHRGYYKRDKGTTKTYEPVRAPIAPALDGLAKSLFWSPDRTIGDRNSGILYYLWHESRYFDEARDIAARLRVDKQPGDAIFGDSTSTPLVALLAKMPIAAHLVDTNSMVFRSGMVKPADAIARLRATYAQEEGRLAWVLVNPRRGFYSIPAFKDFIREDFELVKSWKTRYHGRYQLFRRKR